MRLRISVSGVVGIILPTARRCKPVYRKDKDGFDCELLHYTFSVALYHVRAQYASLVCELPSGGDCGYAGIAPGEEEDQYYVSYYDSSAYIPQGERMSIVPASDVNIAVVKITA
jgi:hypothetical protein